MYDFYFGTHQHIEENRLDWLIFVKRLLPRWCNSIPDSEYCALFDLLELAPAKDASSVLVETGCGASTIVLLDHAMRTGTKLYSWDINPSKGAFLRAVLADTVAAHHGRVLQDHWVFVPSDSTAPGLGIGILNELAAGVRFAFLDGEHTGEKFRKEMDLVTPLLIDQAIFSADDCNYDNVFQNTSYLNMQRQKLGLDKLPDPADNRGPSFRAIAEEKLTQGCASVAKIEDTYKSSYADDIYFRYFAGDRRALEDVGMERAEALDHRLDAWRIGR